MEIINFGKRECVAAGQLLRHKSLQSSSALVILNAKLKKKKSYFVGGVVVLIFVRFISVSFLFVKFVSE